MNSKPRIMIVDDSLFMRNTIRDILEGAGFEICAEAADGIEVLDKYRECSPALITMDIIMADQNGIEAVKNVIALDPAAKIIMISALGRQTMVVRAIQAGAKGFITKPFTPETVVAEIKRVLGM